MSTEITEYESIPEQDNRTAAMVYHGEPRLSLPHFLRDVTFEEDVWKRVTASPLRSPSANQASLRDDAKLRDIVRSIISAANDREKDVLLYHQTRVFAVTLAAFGERFWRFLDEPLRPKKKKRKKSKTESENEGSPEKKEDSEAESDKDPSTLNEWIDLLLKPKTLLAIAAAVFAVIAGHSQLQIHNLNDSIASFEKSVTSLKSSREDLEKHLTDSKTEIEASKNRVSEIEKKLHDQEDVNIQQDSQLTEAINKNETLTMQLAQEQSAGKDLKKGLSEREKKLSDDLSKAQTELITLRTSEAQAKAEAHSAQASRETQEKAAEQQKDFANKALEQVTRMNAQLSERDIEMSRLKLQNAAITLFEHSVRQLRNLANNSRSVRSADIRDELDEFEQRRAVLPR